MYWYHPDYLGNTEFITDLAGNAYQYFWYSPWGESLEEQYSNTGTYSSPYRFNGKELDPETGNYYYGARYYNPQISMWLSVDPLASSFPHLTPYNFLENNPVNMVDPTGMGASPIFGKDGDLLGTDSEGWTGKAIVMDKKDFKPGMNHKNAQTKGTELDKYGEGIKISDKSWDKVEENGGTKMTPYVENNSKETVYYKPDGIDKATGEDLNPGYDASCAYPIDPNSDLYAPIDGVKTSLYKNAVFKVTDGNKVEINNGGHVSISKYGGGTKTMGQLILGGWNSGVGNRSDWKDLQERPLGGRQYKSWEYRY